jgi:hypothetical protein
MGREEEIYRGKYICMCVCVEIKSFIVLTCVALYKTVQQKSVYKANTTETGLSEKHIST